MIFADLPHPFGALCGEIRWVKQEREWRLKNRFDLIGIGAQGQVRRTLEATGIAYAN